MRKAEIEQAKDLADRFAELAEEVLDTKEYNYSKRSATLRRASMDLTRALAEMRRA